MRYVLLISAFVAHAATAGMMFPPAISPEQPVSAHAFGAAAGNQQTLAVASNGQIAFAVWLDQRRGASDLYGSRIGANGAPLDPAGILIANDAAGGSVFWNGTAFVVMSKVGNQTTFSFITPEGAVADRKTMQIFNEMSATLGSGSDMRILLVGDRVATILDSQANFVVAVDLAIPYLESAILAGSSGSEFLILYTMPGANRPLSAGRLDRNGKILGMADTGLDRSMTGYDTLALAGGLDEYLFVSRGPDNRKGFLAHLDKNGVKKSIGSFAPHDGTLRLPYPAAKPGVLFDGSAYQITWTTSEANGSAHTWWTSEPAGDGVPAP